jgi:diguanylate cyclase
MLRFPRPKLLRAGVLIAALAVIASRAAMPAGSPPAAQVSVFALDGMGKGLAPLNGPWQFHVRDDPAFAQFQTPDSTGTNGWEQLYPDKSWGAQNHPGYTGYAWYRKHVHILPAPGASPDLALLIRRIDDAYEIYWNGQLVGRHGHLPPDPSCAYLPPAQTFGLGPICDGVLAVRVWKAPL